MIAPMEAEARRERVLHAPQRSGRYDISKELSGSEAIEALNNIITKDQAFYLWSRM
jgi:hypothetical protein